MNIGISGHQSRPGIDWLWVRETMRRELAVLKEVESAYSSLATGSDQLFAELVLEAGIRHIVVIPNTVYEDNYQNNDDLVKYRMMLARSDRVVLGYTANSQDSFLAAGKVVSDSSDLLFAVWDEKPAAGKGGTADIVNMRVAKRQPVLCLNPISKTVKHM